MKKLTLVLALCLTLVLSSRVKAQETKRAQNVYVELLGQGLLFSANYDTRFGNKRDGLGGRAGIGYIAADGTSVATFPVALNYLLGKGRNFFEIGLGATIATAKSDDFWFGDEEEATGTGTFGTMSFSYPATGGFRLFFKGRDHADIHKGLFYTVLFRSESGIYFLKI